MPTQRYRFLKLLFCLVFWGGESGCTDGPLKFLIPEHMVVSQPDNTEVMLTDFVKMNALTALFYVNGDCSPCLVELNGWQNFFAEYSNLTPLLIVRTEHPTTFPAILEFFGFFFPVVYDYDLTLWTHNRAVMKAALIVLDRDAGILYAGKPEHDTSFAHRYHTWINPLVDNK